MVAATPLLIASTAISAGMSVLGGIQANNASKAEAQQLQQQADFEKTRARQEEANRQAKLTQILADGMAMQAGRGGSLGSGSNLAIESFSIQEANRESDIANFDSRFKRSQLRASASQAKMAGRSSLIRGIGQGVGTVASGVQSYRDTQRTTTDG